jgi:hypothetical protein
VVAAAETVGVVAAVEVAAEKAVAAAETATAGSSASRTAIDQRNWLIDGAVGAESSGRAALLLTDTARDLDPLPHLRPSAIVMRRN